MNFSSPPQSEQIDRMLAVLAGGGSDVDDLFRQAIMATHDGVLIVTVAPGVKDNPITFANPAFERLTGYRQPEILGHDCRFLQAGDRGQPAIATVRAAIDAGRPCRVVLRNYRKDGSMFWNELSLAPMRGPDGRVWRYVGIQKDVSERMEPTRA